MHLQEEFFLGGGFSHLLPESGHSFEALGLSDLPISPILTVFGFLLVFFLEKVIFYHGPSDSHEHLPFAKFQDEETNLPTVSSSNTNNSNSVELEIRDDSIPISEISSSPSSSPSSSTSTTSPSSAVSKLFMPIILTLVLSIHSIIAGFSIGVQKQSSEVLTLFIAVIAHKWTESFALGVSLVQNQVNQKMQIFKFILVYSSMAPLGLILGIILEFSVVGNTQIIVNAIVSGIAAGTFIYISLIMCARISSTTSASISSLF